MIDAIDPKRESRGGRKGGKRGRRIASEAAVSEAKRALRAAGENRTMGIIHQRFFKICHSKRISDMKWDLKLQFMVETRWTDIGATPKSD